MRILTYFASKAQLENESGLVLVPRQILQDIGKGQDGRAYQRLEKSLKAWQEKGYLEYTWDRKSYTDIKISLDIEKLAGGSTWLFPLEAYHLKPVAARLIEITINKLYTESIWRIRRDNLYAKIPLSTKGNSTKSKLEAAIAEINEKFSQYSLAYTAEGRGKDTMLVFTRTWKQEQVDRALQPGAQGSPKGDDGNLDTGLQGFEPAKPEVAETAAASDSGAIAEEAPITKQPQTQENEKNTDSDKRNSQFFKRSPVTTAGVVRCADSPVKPTTGEGAIVADEATASAGIPMETRKCKATKKNKIYDNSERPGSSTDVAGSVLQSEPKYKPTVEEVKGWISGEPSEKQQQEGEEEVDSEETKEQRRRQQSEFVIAMQRAGKSDAEIAAITKAVQRTSGENKQQLQQIQKEIIEKTAPREHIKKDKYGVERVNLAAVFGDQRNNPRYKAPASCAETQRQLPIYAEKWEDISDNLPDWLLIGKEMLYRCWKMHQDGEKRALAAARWVVKTKGYADAKGEIFPTENRVASAIGSQKALDELAALQERDKRQHEEKARQLEAQNEKSRQIEAAKEEREKAEKQRSDFMLEVWCVPEEERRGLWREAERCIEKDLPPESLQGIDKLPGGRDKLQRQYFCRALLEHINSDRNGGSFSPSLLNDRSIFLDRNFPVPKESAPQPQPQEVAE